DERGDDDLSAHQLIGTSWEFSRQISDGMLLTLNPPPIQGLGQRAGFTVELQQRGGGTVVELAEASNRFQDAARQNPAITGLNATLRVTLPQVFVELNREKTRMMGIRLAAVFDP